MPTFDHALTDLALIIGFLLQFGVTVWWASKITAHVATLPELRRELAEHMEEDRAFQLQMTRDLGAINARNRDRDRAARNN